MTRLPLNRTNCTSCGGFPIDPFFKRCICPFHFADLLVRLAYRLQNHLTIHTDQNFMVQDRALEFRGQRIGEGLDRCLERKIDHG